ncbi:MAG: hypothetical protein ABI882_09905 [Acidobacteriota bacterium]
MNLILAIGLSATAVIAPGLLWGSHMHFRHATDSAFQGKDEGQVRDQVTKSVPLARGSNVRVSGLNGALIVETWEGETAEIDITVTASDAEALARRPLLVEETGNSLTIRTQEKRDQGRDRGWVRHRARLKLPRTVNLEISGINGRVDVGEITGTIGINGVNGAVSVAEAAEATNINGINGHVSVSLTRLGEKGLEVHGINGGVELGFLGSVNASLDVNGINGGVSSDFPLTVLGEMKRGEMRGTIGSGGPRINVHGINGGVQLKRR